MYIFIYFRETERESMKVGWGQKEKDKQTPH